MSLSEYIRRYRADHDLSQRELAEQVGMSASAIGMYEAGKRYPRPPEEGKLARFFGVSIASLRDDVDLTDTGAGFYTLPEDPLDLEISQITQGLDRTGKRHVLDVVTVMQSMTRTQRESLARIVRELSDMIEGK